MTYMEPVVDFYIHRITDNTMRYDFVGCKDEDITYLEEASGVALPKPYIEYLKWAGHSSAGIFEGLVEFRYLLLIQRRARRLLHENRIPIERFPANAVVFWWDSQDTGFVFFVPDEGDNPKVYRFQEGLSTSDDPFPLAASSIVGFFYDLVTGYSKLPRKTDTASITIQNLIAIAPSVVQWRQSQYQFHRRVIGVTEESVALLESRIGYILPLAYREFLRWGGIRIADFLEWERWDYNHLLKLQEWGRDTVGFSKLPPTAFVAFWYSQGLYFDFFDVRDGDNPPMYRYEQDFPEKGAFEVTSSFTQYLLNVIETIKW